MLIVRPLRSGAFQPFTTPLIRNSSSSPTSLKESLFTFLRQYSRSGYRQYREGENLQTDYCNHMACKIVWHGTGPMLGLASIGGLIWWYTTGNKQ